jgi:hypothetical protein
MLFSVSVYGGAIINGGLNVSNDGNGSIKIIWTTQQETNVSEFILERSPNQIDWSEIKTFDPKGSNSTYTYIDDPALKSNDFVFYYRLKIVDNDGNISYINSQSVNQRISGVKQTWGSIKAMFR